MRSMLGVPIVSKGTVIGAFYLTDKKQSKEFGDADQALIERFAAHAAVVVENARLFEQSRELSVVEERNRLARDLHDSVTQTLFSLSLTAQAAADLMDRDPERARVEVTRVSELARGALEEMRTLVFELRPAALDAEGLVGTLQKHLDVMRRAYGADISLNVTGNGRLDPDLELEVYRILQEALNNVIKHADARSIAISIAIDSDAVRASVRDDGQGFDPKAQPVRAKHLGLTSMEERARNVGGAIRIESAPGHGTTISLEVKRDLQ
jgi:signal transduction histidine kinase